MTAASGRDRRPYNPPGARPTPRGFHKLPEVARYLYHEPRTRTEVSVLLQGKIAASVLPAEGKGLCLAAELAETGELVGDCTPVLPQPGVPAG